MDNYISYIITVFYNNYSNNGSLKEKTFTDINKYYDFVNKGYEIYRPDSFIITTDEEGNEDFHQHFNFSVALNKIKKLEIA